ncbi:hypothetical protein [Tuwongella immobilis]|uniref:Uncharacterized protein n=1 Tax=Tuwongella immobilis TaxID=692036 RepID=A0A6C2YV68_9BACT|nr:hypothetical protein [Tuwongella immobilis]VIP04879.1 unnamed protein product [Tuwongella immobilis]VTS07117.1 unnamed protein product [Tuwongella immobilis]
MSELELTALDAGDDSLVQGLRALQPSTPQGFVPTTLLAAGHAAGFAQAQAAARKQLRRWQMTTLAFALLSAALAWVPLMQRFPGRPGPASPTVLTTVSPSTPEKLSPQLPEANAVPDRAAQPASPIPEDSQSAPSELSPVSPSFIQEWLTGNLPEAPAWLRRRQAMLNGQLDSNVALDPLPGGFGPSTGRISAGSLYLSETPFLDFPR